MTEETTHIHGTQIGDDQTKNPDSVCPECGSGKIIRDFDIGEKVCTGCGVVISQKDMYSGPERRVFDEEDRLKRERTGPASNPLLHDHGLTTTIGYRKKKRPMTYEKMRDESKLRKWQKRARVQTSQERNLSVALSEMSGYVQRFKSKMPKATSETASAIYRRALEKKLMRGRSISLVALTALYTAFRQTGFPKSLDEMVKGTRYTKEDLGRVYRLMVREEILGIVPPPSYSEAARVISGTLGMPGRTQAMIYRILKEANEIKLTDGKSPQGMAAAATYIGGILCSGHDQEKNSASKKHTQREIADAAHVTEVTVRNRYKQLIEKFLFEVPM